MTSEQPTRKKRTTINKAIYELVLRMCYEQGCSLNHIADTLSINRHTVSKLLKIYENGKEFVSANEKKKLTWQNKNAVLQDYEQTIFNTIACTNALTLKELSERISQNDREYSISTISRKLKKMGVTRKRLSLVPYERNSIEKIDARAIYAAELSIVADSNLIFLDETGFNEHTRRSYGYSMRNSKAYSVVPANRGINNSLICAISSVGVVAYSYKQGAFNSEHFRIFITEKLIPHFRSNPNHILIMDNARFHKSSVVLNLFRQNNIAYKFLVPYSPQLNPIEEFFSIIKSRYHELKTRNTNINILDALDNIMHTSVDFINICNNLYKHMRFWIDKARRREEFI